MKKIYRTIIRYEVLSAEPIPANMTMGQIEYECDEGSYSGMFLSNVVTNEELVDEVAIAAIQRQGSSPEFFFMED